MHNRIFITITALAIFIFSCKPSDEEKARIRLNNAKELLEKGDTIFALMQLDTVLLYPKAVYAINSAKNMMAEINFILLKKKESELDSLDARITRLETLFDRQKTEFDRFTQYIHKRQNFERAWNKSFIQVHLDEKGNIFLSSNYHGKDVLNHYAIRVYDGELSTKTDSVPVGSDQNHQSDFMDYKWEKVSYVNGKDNGVMQFIADHADKNLKAVFIGRRQFYIILESFDKQAIKDALELSAAIKQKGNLEKELQVIRKKIPVQN